MKVLRNFLTGVALAFSGVVYMSGLSYDHAKDTIRVSIATGNQPLSYIGKNGELQGIDVAYWHELGKRINKKIEFVQFKIGEGKLQLEQLQKGEIDVVGCSNFGLSNARLKTFKGLVVDYKPSFYWSVQFLQEDGKIPEGYADPLTVAKNLLVNRKKIGSRKNSTSIARTYLTHVATSSAPEGLGLSLIEATALLDDLIVDISGFDSIQLVQGLARGDYFALWVKDGQPLDATVAFQEVDPRISGHNNIPKDEPNCQMGTGYLFDPSRNELLADLEKALGSMIADGTYEKLQRVALEEANNFFGYDKTAPDYFAYPFCNAAPVIITS